MESGRLYLGLGRCKAAGPSEFVSCSNSFSALCDKGDIEVIQDDKGKADDVSHAASR